MSLSRTADGNTGLEVEFRRELGLYDATMVVIGSMIGSGIFLVPATMARFLGSPGWLLAAWVITGVLTVTAALSYGELAAMMPRAGGQYVYLRQAFGPLWGFLYGWTLFLVIQTGTIAAVAVATARYLGVLWPEVSENRYLIRPLHLTDGYAVSLSTVQLVAILLIVLLTATHMCGLHYGKIIQNLFTTVKTGALLGLIAVCLLLGWRLSTVQVNFADFWTPRGLKEVTPGLEASTTWGLLVALCVVQTGSLFSSDAWNNITFVAGEVKEPRRTIPLALLLGTVTVISLYLLTNLGYLAVLPFEQIQQAPDDRVATAALATVLSGPVGVTLMALGIMISCFGCNNGLILTGARAYYAMARDGLFFRLAGQLNNACVPGWGLLLQGVWAAALVLPRVYNPETQAYGNLYSDLLDYVISAALIFYIMSIIGIFQLRINQPAAERPYRAFGYPVVPALYIAGAGLILGLLFGYRPATTWPGLAIALLGVPVYALWRRRS